MKRQRNIEEMAQNICDLWNEKIPTNTDVEYEEVVGVTGPITVKTRSQAWVLCGQPVVMIEGKSGGVVIYHMTGWHYPALQQLRAASKQGVH